MVGRFISRRTLRTQKKGINTEHSAPALIQMTWMMSATVVQIHMPAMMESRQNGVSAKETGV